MKKPVFACGWSISHKYNSNTFIKATHAFNFFICVMSCACSFCYNLIGKNNEDLQSAFCLIIKSLENIKLAKMHFF